MNNSFVSLVVIIKYFNVMSNIKFKTKILKDGIIKIPDNVSIINDDVEVTLNFQIEKKREKNIIEFLNKWSGVLSDENIDKYKYEYLRDKYK